MVNISKQTEDSILFEFQNSQHYLYGNGEISVPLNSLQLVIDSSDMISFKKLDGDPFVSFNIDESNFASKAALVEFYETEMVGGGGIPTEEIQEMIDESIAPIKAETVTDAEYISSAHTINLYNISGTVLSSIDATDFLTDGMLDSASVEDVTISGETQKCLVLVFNTDAGKDNINIPISELFDPSLVQCDEKIIEGCELITKQAYYNVLNDGRVFSNLTLFFGVDEEDYEVVRYFKPNFDIVQNDAILLGIIGGELNININNNMCSDGNHLDDKGWYTLTNGDYKNSAFVLLSIEDGQITNVSTVKSTFDEGDLTVINHGDYVEIKKWIRQGYHDGNLNNVLDVGVAFLASGETPSFDAADCGVKWLNVPYDGIGDDDLGNCIKFFSVYKIYPAESASERIDRIEDEIIAKSSAYTVVSVEGGEEVGVLNIKQRNLNILGDECTVSTPFMKYDSNSIGYDAGKGLYSTMWILDIDKINEQTPTASISGGEVMQISSLQNAIFEFDLSQSTCGEINGELMSPSIEFGHFSVSLNANRFNFMAASFDEETGEESWTEFEGKIVRKGNTVALEFNLDSPITDLEIEFHASGLNCDEQPELIEAKYYEGLSLEWSHIKLDDKLTTYDTAIDAINNEIDEKEEVISRTFYQLEDEISGLTESLGDKIDSSAITSSITSASTETEIPSAKAVYDAIGEGGGGKAIEAGRGIAITTGESADTISLGKPLFLDEKSSNLQIDAEFNGSNTISQTGSNSNLVIGTQNNVKMYSSHNIICGQANEVSTSNNIIVGYFNKVKDRFSQVFGNNNIAYKPYSTICGFYNEIKNYYEFAAGKYNNSTSGQTDSGNTLFSVGNGTDENARHNAFEIKTNGDIYITSGSSDIKLQDHLGGGGSITIDPSLDSASTNAVANSAITEAINEKARKTVAFGSYVLGEISGQPFIKFRSAANSDILNVNEIYYPRINNKGTFTTNKTWAVNNLNFSLVETSAITSSITSASTDSQVPSAKAVYDAIGEGGGGLDEDFLQANANALYELKQEGKATNERFDNYYTKTASDGRYASNASIKKAYYDKAYVDDKLLAISASLNELNDDKQDALVAGEGISISGNVISAEGGGGAEYSAGTNIEITTANTINCTIPISAGTGNYSIKGDSCSSQGFASVALGKSCTAKGEGGVAIGDGCETMVGNYDHGSVAIGYKAMTKGGYGSVAIGFGTNSQSEGEIGCGKYNISTYVSKSNFGNSGNTEFSVGNGGGPYNKHNALEIRQNGDLYYVDTYDTTTQNYYEKPMLKLQDVIKDLTDRIAALETQLNNN